MNEQENLHQEAENSENKPASDMQNEIIDQASTEAQPDDLKKVKDDLAEAKDKYLRLYAEFENHRRRTAKERLELIQTANEQLIKALLPVSDDFDRAEKSFKELSGKESEGFFLILNKFRKILEQNGLKPMDTSNGIFDADLHEAITQIPAPDQSGKIIDVVEKGYLLHEKVIRHAKVVVGS
jgi:molecular chaperone GrpE